MLPLPEQCGRAHLFDLEALRLGTYGLSTWSVSQVSPLPPCVAVVLLDDSGNCHVLGAPVPSADAPAPLGTFMADARYADAWQLAG